MSVDDETFDALGWAARTFAWERRLRELETALESEEPAPDPAGAVAVPAPTSANRGNGIVRVRVKKA
jgi:hypothetical protein